MLIDEFELIHKNLFGDSVREPVFSRDRARSSPVHVGFSGKGNQGKSNTDVCHYCHELGHLKSSCPLRKGRKQHAGNRQVKPTAMAASSLVPTVNMKEDCGQAVAVNGLDESFLPFVRDGCARLVDGDKDARNSYILESVLPFSDNKILMRGMGTNVLPVPGPWDVLGL